MLNEKSASLPKDLQTTFMRKLVALMKNNHLSTKLAVKNISNERLSDKKGENEYYTGNWKFSFLKLMLLLAIHTQNLANKRRVY